MNNDDTIDIISNSILSSSSQIKECIFLSPQIYHAIKTIANSLKKGKKVVLFGNGGSAADAQHIAAELVGKFKIKRKSIPAISLTTDSSILTSISNDMSFDQVFSRQCESLVLKDDIVIGISTSGKSTNIKKALQLSKKNGATTIGLLGNKGGFLKNYCDISIIVNSSSTPKIQECHRVIYHIMCEHIEKILLDIKK